MNNRYIFNTSKKTGDRILSKEIFTPKIRSEFFVRLFSLLQFEPEINNEGYEFFIKDVKTNTDFSAGLNGFGPGYFSESKSEQTINVINEFDSFVFDKNLKFIDCKIEFEHDFGKSILGCINNELIEQDLE